MERPSGEETWNHFPGTAKSEVGGWERCMLFWIFGNKLQVICSIS